MDLKTGIFSLALGALLLGSTARADDTQQLQAPHNADAQVQSQGFRGTQTYSWGNNNGGDRRNDRLPFEDRRPDGRYYHRTPQPPAPRDQRGSYQLKLVEQYVPGHNEQVWVPQDCGYGSRRGPAQCRGGYYAQQWVADHYETTEQWVWVSTGWGSGSSAWGTPAGYWHN